MGRHEGLLPQSISAGEGACKVALRMGAHVSARLATARRRSRTVVALGMTVEGQKPSPERARTDESLRTEREKTDGALTDRQETIDETADEVVRRARETADAVVFAAREKADQPPPSHLPPEDLIAQQRLREDEALRNERAAADESLRLERNEDAESLSRLLPLEREKTDRFLLTERVRSDNAVAHRDDFLSIVSHDLRNLLGGIVMSASLLSDAAPEDDAGKKTVDGMKRIQRYAARMNRLIGDLVDVASIDAGKLALTPTRGDSGLLIAETVDLFQGLAAAKGISLKSVSLAPTLQADFDHDRMLQVLANLITNSIKFTEAGGNISVAGERAETGLRFCVSDTGSGVPGNLLEAIFERFWQVGKNDRRGVGLGLYISKCIVEAHGGRIWAESVSGKGSTFSFTVPA
jgi:signal transduction histidine kinase